MGPTLQSMHSTEFREEMTQQKNNFPRGLSVAKMTG